MKLRSPSDERSYCLRTPETAEQIADDERAGDKGNRTFAYRNAHGLCESMELSVTSARSFSSNDASAIATRATMLPTTFGNMQLSKRRPFRRKSCAPCFTASLATSSSCKPLRTRIGIWGAARKSRSKVSIPPLAIVARRIGGAWRQSLDTLRRPITITLVPNRHV